VRGACTVDLAWRAGKVTAAVFYPERRAKRRITAPQGATTLAFEPNVPLALDPSRLT
jgi:hypothetical protein